MLRKVLALSASERVRAGARLVRFALAVAIPSVTLWLAYGVAWVLIVKGTPEPAIPSLFTGFILAASGIVSTQAAAFGIRYLHWRRRLGPSRFLLALIWVLVVSAAWWGGAYLLLFLTGVLRATGVLGQTWLNVPLAVAIHYLSYGIRRLVVPRIRLDWLPSRSTAGFRAHPKALSIRDTTDMTEIMDGLDSLRAAYGQSPDEGNKVLTLLEHHLTVSSDPRYDLPMPLPVAVQFLTRELELRRVTGQWTGTVQVAPAASFPSKWVVEPAALHALAIFAGEYAQYHKGGDVVLTTRFSQSPQPCVEIGTNTRGGDLWFVVDESSRAQGAKDLLVDTLNRLADRGTLYESGEDVNGNLVFRIFARSGDPSEAPWEDIERRLGHDVQLLSVCTLSEGSNRVYSCDDRIHKVQLIDSASPKPLALAEEYNILRRLAGIDGVPQSPSYAEYANFAVLSYDLIEGQSLPDYLSGRDFERSAWFRCLSLLSSLLNRIHNRGVIHRDLRPDNILVADDGRLGLIDFDQAVAGAYDARQVDILGKREGTIPACIAIPQLIEMLGLNQEYYDVVDKLTEAWHRAARSDASSPGRNIAYYRWLFGHTELPGERDWFTRWDLIFKALREFLPGARVLDLGCNLGLVATHCMLHGAQAVTGVDAFDDILDAARMLAGAAGVDVDFVKGDLNAADSVDRLLGQEYDIVLALSVAHWIENRDQAARILRAAPVLLYEGHAPASQEAARLRELGFSRVQLVGYSERLRALYLACRDTADP